MVLLTGERTDSMKRSESSTYYYGIPSSFSSIWETLEKWVGSNYTSDFSRFYLTNLVGLSYATIAKLETISAKLSGFSSYPDDLELFCKSAAF